MSKLLKLKEWLTLSTAANTLATMLSEPITVADLLQLALEKQLLLSVRMIDLTPALRGQEVGIDTIFGANLESQWVESLDATFADNPRLLQNYLGGGRCIAWNEDSIEPIDGVWDLPMLPGESYAIEVALARLLNSPLPQLPLHEGVYLKRGDVYCQLMEPLGDFNESQLQTHDDNKLEDEWDHQEDAQAARRAYRNNFCPALILPDSAQFVIRTTALNDFIASLTEPSVEDKPLTTKGKNSYLSLIAVLAKQAGYDLSQRGITTSLEAVTQQLDCPVGDDTIRKIIKEVNELTAKTSV